METGKCKLSTDDTLKCQGIKSNIRDLYSLPCSSISHLRCSWKAELFPGQYSPPSQSLAPTKLTIHVLFSVGIYNNSYH